MNLCDIIVYKYGVDKMKKIIFIEPEMVDSTNHSIPVGKNNRYDYSTKKELKKLRKFKNI